MTQQAPLHTGFGALTTAHEVITGRDLEGVVAIVTGGHAGVGLETTRALAEAGATVIVGARDVTVARAALAAIPRATAARLDLADPASIDAFAAHVAAAAPALPLLVANAGVMVPAQARDARGYDSQLATNHLGHFQLAARLWPLLRAAAGARVVVLSSRGHAMAAVDLEDPSFERRPYDKWQAYGQSKTANALFALALDARGQAHGVRAFSVHPGAVTTNLAHAIPAGELQALRAAAPGAIYKTPAQGAATSVWCATSPQLGGHGGVYCEDVDIAPAVPADFAGVTGVRPWACDAGVAARLWTLSERMTGVPFAI